jgi:methionyl-tRNA formyltransferase
MRIIIITQGISRIVYPLLSSKYDIVGIIECAPRGYTKRRKNSSLLKKLYHFLFRVATLETLSKSKRIPYYFMTSADDVQLQTWVKNLSPDLIVVFSMSQLLKPIIYKIPKYGTINIHPSILPKYRGPNPDFWHYMNMEKEQGITIHYIDEGEDTGDILYQQVVSVPLGMKSPERLDLLITNTAVPALFKVIDGIHNNTIVPYAQPIESPTPRARNIKESEHTKCIDWYNCSVEKIWNILRGTELWLNVLPAPRGIYTGSRWIIDDFVRMPVSGEYEYGKIYQNKKLHFVVCKDGIIYIHCKFKIINLIKSIYMMFFQKHR